MQKIVKREFAKRLFWFGISFVAAVGLLGIKGCIKRVQLPEAPAYPGTLGELASPLDTYRKRIGQKILGMESKVWARMEEFWGVERLWGKLFLELKMQGGQVTKCSLRRSELQAELTRQSKSWGMVARKRAMRLKSYQVIEIWKVEKQRRRSLCALLREQNWPTFSSEKPVSVRVLLVRHVRQTREKRPSSRIAPPRPSSPSATRTLPPTSPSAPTSPSEGRSTTTDASSASPGKGANIREGKTATQTR